MDPLSGTSWILAVLIGTSVHAGGGTASMTFDNGRVYGSDGCNRYSSAYALAEDRIRIDANLVISEEACVQAALQRAVAFVEALTNASRYRREGEQLILLDAEGRMLAIFQLGGSRT
jgi:heat shock protein HslJ